jgi:hypothetical protein
MAGWLLLSPRRALVTPRLRGVVTPWPHLHSARVLQLPKTMVLTGCALRTQHRHKHQDPSLKVYSNCSDACQEEVRKTAKSVSRNSWLLGWGSNVVPREWDQLMWTPRLASLCANWGRNCAQVTVWGTVLQIICYSTSLLWNLKAHYRVHRSATWPCSEPAESSPVWDTAHI